MIDNNNIGAGPTRNLAMDKVRTDWVGFCDDDDELDEHYHEWLKDYKNYDVVVFRMKNSPNGAIPESNSVEHLEYNKVGISFALKTSLARKYPFKNMQGEDYDLLIRLVEAGCKVKIVDHVAYYLHGKNGTN